MRDGFFNLYNFQLSHLLEINKKASRENYIFTTRFLYLHIYPNALIRKNKIIPRKIQYL